MNKKLLSVFVFAGLLLFVFSGCEWEDADDFNTSQGAGIAVNFSGVYRPREGSVVVPPDISRLILTHVGNTIEVYDSNGSKYEGRIGSPGIVEKPDPVTGIYGAGANMLQAQLSFSGVNGKTRKDVSFVGIIHAVAVRDMTFTTSISQGSGNAYTNSGSNVIKGDSTNKLSTMNFGTGDSGGYHNAGGQRYSITQANTQYVLEGNWIEGSEAQYVAGIAPALNGDFMAIPGDGGDTIPSYEYSSDGTITQVEWTDSN